MSDQTERRPAETEAALHRTDLQRRYDRQDIAPADLAELYSVLTAAGVPIFTAPPAGIDYTRPAGWQRLTADGNAGRLAARRPGDAVMAVCGGRLVVVDVDPRNGGRVAAVREVLLELGVRIFAEIATPGGGVHFYVAGHPEIASAHSSISGWPGVDVQSYGRNVFLPGTLRDKYDGAGYLVVAEDLATLVDGDDDGAEAFAGWIAAHRSTSVEAFEPAPLWQGAAPDARQAAYLTAVVQGQARELAAVRSGGRNDALNVAAVKCGNYVAGAGLDERRVVEALTAASSTNRLIADDGEASVAATIRSGLRCGKLRPRAVPDAPQAPRLNGSVGADRHQPAGGSDGAGHAGAEAPSASYGPEPHSGQARIAYRLAARFPERIIHVHGLGWLRWTGTRWQQDDQGEATRAVLDVLRDALAESLTDKALRADVRKCESAAGIAGVLAIASALHPLAVTVDDLDPDPYLLNVANGTLDLHTLELRPHAPADRITKVTRAAYRPGAGAAVWDTFLDRVLPDEEVRAFLRRYAGAGLVGRVIEHVLAILTGRGRNGKGVFYKAVRYALGDYAAVAEPELFMHRENAHPTGEMDLLGVRVVFVSESDEGRRLATATVKRLTGGDRIRARRMRQDFVEFEASHTATVVTNFLPKVTGDDAALWARLRVVPFDVVIPPEERDVHLDEKMETEADAVLAWAVAGWVEYTRRGLDEPQAVLTATDRYQADSDALRRFLADCCIVNQHMKVPSAELFSRWLKWCADDGTDPGGKRTFMDAMDKKGFGAVRGHGGVRHRAGITLAAEENDDG